MKKIMYIAAALLVLVGCNKNSQENKENAPANYGTITGKIELPQGEDAKAGARMITAPNGWKALSEAFTMQWESTDKIYIYNQSECKELTVESIDAQTGNATFAGELLTDMSDYKVAYGYNPMAGTTAFAVDYIADNYRPFAWGTGEYSIFTIDNFGPVMGLKLKGNVKVDKIEVVVLEGDVAQATYTMTLSTAIELNAETFAMVYFPLNALGDADKLEAKFYQGSILCKTQAFTTLPAKNRVTTYPTIEGINYDPYNGHAYVDLGLPSGLKWATCNVGATKPEDYGDYFAWGETKPKSDYSWDLYKYCCTGDWTGMTKYTYPDNQKSGIWYNSDDTFIGDNKTVLDSLADDAAVANWGGVWRMPTAEEFQELLNNCNHYWTTQGGVNGRLFISRINGNKLFLPAAGYFDGTSLRNNAGNGYYWSSSLYTKDSSYGRYLYVSSADSGTLEKVNPDLRREGLSVRPVSK